MGRRGPAPKPSALKQLEGNPGKRTTNTKEPRPATKIPACPKHLSAEAHKEWRRVSKQLADLRLLTEVDRAALAAYCQAWARWVEAEKEMAKEDFRMITITEKGYPVLSPWFSVADKALKQMKAFLAEFGMTPSSRSRVQVEPEGEVDEYEEYLRLGRERSNAA